ncbi:MAG: alpha/beta hydrolase family protein [Eubacteriales bacterium]|nr:alpha/beta hydrolase family protein [Eubacteriales bacterium]MDD4422342.1 alpha/beta hydrolase family protein [Eubacteriales bacterium]
MALLHVNFSSSVLGVCTNMEVILPQKGSFTQTEENTYPVLYLLHGMSDDCTIWGRRTSIERYAAKYGITVVMPSAQLSYYSDMVYGSRFFTFFSEELPAICHDFFPRISQKREDTFVAGLSMGGYGAFKLAMRRPEKYAFAGSLSGAMDIKNNVLHPEVWKLAFGGNDMITGSENDLFHLSSKLKESGKEIPEFYFSCGTSDVLAFPQNERFDAHLNEIGLSHTYERFEGGHTWEYWDEHIQDILSRLPLKK